MTRRYGLAATTALVVASMVGSGVFTTSGILLATLPSPAWVLLAWLVGGLIAGCGALSYGALARRFPESGGEYLFLSRAVHPAAGNIAGWISLLVGFSAPMAAAAHGFGEYLAPWLPSISPRLTGTVLLCGLAWLHGFLGLGGSWLQTVAVAFQLSLMAAFMLLAYPRLPSHALASLPGSGFEAGRFFTALIWVSFSYSGWNAAVYIGGEVREPRRNLPLALLLGTGLVTALYLALNFTFLAAAEPVALAGKVDVGRSAAFALGGAAWADFMTLLVALALSLSVSAMMMAGPRVYARMARDGYLPACFETYEDGAPRRAIGLQCALALLLLWSWGFRELLTYIGFTLGLSSAVTVHALIRLRLREGRELGVTGWPWAPALYLLATVALTLSAMVHQPRASLWGLATILGSGLMGWVTSRVRNAYPTESPHRK